MEGIDADRRRVLFAFLDNDDLICNSPASISLSATALASSEVLAIFVANRNATRVEPQNCIPMDKFSAVALDNKGIRWTAARD